MWNADRSQPEATFARRRVLCVRYKTRRIGRRGCVECCGARGLNGTQLRCRVRRVDGAGEEAPKSSQVAGHAELPPAARCIYILTDVRCGGCVRRDAAGEMRGAREGASWVFAGRPGDTGNEEKMSEILRGDGARGDTTRCSGWRFTHICVLRWLSAAGRCARDVRGEGRLELCFQWRREPEADSARSSCWVR